MTVTIPSQEYRRVQGMATAARRAFEVLNSDNVNDDDISEVAWQIWRAMEGNMSREIH